MKDEDNTSAVRRVAPEVAAQLREKRRRERYDDAAAHPHHAKEKVGGHTVAWVQVIATVVPLIVVVIGGAAIARSQLEGALVRLEAIETILHEIRARQDAADRSVVRFEERLATLNRDLAEARREIATLQEQMSFRRSDLAVLAAYHRDAPLSDDIQTSRRGRSP